MIDPTTHRTMSERSYHGATSRSLELHKENRQNSIHNNQIGIYSSSSHTPPAHTPPAHTPVLPWMLGEKTPHFYSGLHKLYPYVQLTMNFHTYI